MKIKVPVIPIQEINGQLVIHNAPDAANDDWLRAARLKKEGKLDELAAFEAQKLYYWVEDYEVSDDLIIF
jgi:hypothetical protein